MRHFVVYHNPDRTPHFVTQVQSSEAFSDKRPDGLVGSRIWVVGRVPHPNRYYLGATFVCEAFGAGSHGFNTGMSGNVGSTFADRVPVDHLAWLPALREQMGNYQFGLTEVSDAAIIGGLIAAAATDGVTVTP